MYIRIIYIHIYILLCISTYNVSLSIYIYIYIYVYEYIHGFPLLGDLQASCSCDFNAQVKRTALQAALDLLEPVHVEIHNASNLTTWPCHAEEVVVSLVEVPQ